MRFGRSGHLDMGDAEASERVHDRVDDDGERRRGAALTRGADAEWMRGRRHLADVRGEKRKIAGARHRVIHERSGERLAAAGIVEAMLEQGLPDALRDAAVGLAVDDERVHGAPGIVDRGVTHDLDHAGLRVDLDPRTRASHSHSRRH